jgi:hypothetical protein
VADDRRLPGLDYGAPIGLDDLAYAEEVYADEIRTRTKLIAGSYRSAGASYGIVAEKDPTTATSSVDTPFRVASNDLDGSKIDVFAGFAITKAGDYIYLIAEQTSFEVALAPAVGEQYVVYIEYLTEADDETVQANRYQENVARRRVRISDDAVVKIADYADWTDGTIFTVDRLMYIIPIAFLNVVTDTTEVSGIRMEVSMDGTSLSENRPWWSPVDMEHRADIGTGLSSISHNLGLSDLSSGNMSLYHQLLNHGMIISRDVSFPGVSGSLCTEIIDPTREQIDTTGEITGTIGSKYYILLRYPV